MTEIEKLRFELSDARMELYFAKNKFEKLDEQKDNLIVKLLSDKWTAQGVPETVIEKIKPVLSNKNSQVFKLSDEQVLSMKFFDDLFSGFNQKE
ncbi:MAG: hypothetical protein IJQ99_02240 [Synergistaceae bacterium]|nr:hypothetical protein [Synergistaceae bacterium]